MEVLSYGHLPLAYSARCFTARSEDRRKMSVKSAALVSNGRNVLSQENQQVFVLNGIQTMSGYVYNLGNELASMQGLLMWSACHRRVLTLSRCSTPSALMKMALHHCR